VHAPGEPFADHDLGADAGRGLDREDVRQASRPDDTESEAGRRDVASVEDLLETRDARPAVDDARNEQRRCAIVDAELDLPATRVLVGVPPDLGHRGRESGLILRIDTEPCGELPRALTSEHDVVLARQLHRHQQPLRHRDHYLGLVPCRARRTHDHDQRVIAPTGKVAIEHARHNTRVTLHEPAISLESHRALMPSECITSSASAGHSYVNSWILRISWPAMPL
jgi:hypothetical protein